MRPVPSNPDATDAATAFGALPEPPPGTACARRITSKALEAATWGRLARRAAALLRPDRLIDHAKSQLKSEGRALETAFKTLIHERRRARKQAADLLKSYSYERVRERGFVLVTDIQGLAVDSVDMLNPGMDVRLGFHDGKAGATVNEVKGPRGGSGEKKRRTRKSKPGSADSRQGKLL